MSTALEFNTLATVLSGPVNTYMGVASAQLLICNCYDRETLFVESYIFASESIFC